MKDVQSILDKRAKKKCEEDANALRNYIGSVFKGSNIKIQVKENVQISLWDAQKVLHDTFIKSEMPRYLEKETRDFMKKFEHLSKELEEFKEEFDYHDHN